MWQGWCGHDVAMVGLMKSTPEAETTVLSASVAIETVNHCIISHLLTSIINVLCCKVPARNKIRLLIFMVGAILPTPISPLPFHLLIFCVHNQTFLWYSMAEWKCS